jgi:hypothetical protein
MVLILVATPILFWRAPSGFYYPWSSGFAYTDRPILVMPPNSSNPLRTQPAITTVIADLDSYLDNAKQEGKISDDNYQDLRQRARYLLKKEESMARLNDGVLDPDQEVELRKDVESLSSEVAYRVRPKPTPQAAAQNRTTPQAAALRGVVLKLQ